MEGDDDDEEDGLGMRQSSGMAQMVEGAEDGDLGRGRKRRGLKGASSRPAGKGRRRRLDEEDEQMEDLRIAKRRKRGGLEHCCQSCTECLVLLLKQQLSQHAVCWYLSLMVLPCVPRSQAGCGAAARCFSVLL